MLSAHLNSSRDPAHLNRIWDPIVLNLTILHKTSTMIICRKISHRPHMFSRNPITATMTLWLPFPHHIMIERRGNDLLFCIAKAGRLFKLC